MSPKEMWSFQLKAAGYYCSSGGKVHHQFGALAPKYHQVLYDDDPKQFRLIDWHPSKFKSIVTTGGHRGGYASTDPAEDWKYYDARSATDAVAFLDSYNGDAPFYREVGFYSPHGPHATPIRFKELYDPEEFTPPAEWHQKFSRADFTKYDLPETPQLKAENLSWWQHSVRNYFSALSHVDYHIGRVWDALKASPHAENTIVVVISDHGFHLGNLNRFCKKTLWEQVARVPFVIHDPADPTAQEIETPVSTADVGPTVLEMTGTPQQPQSIGQSLCPELRGEQENRGPIPTIMNDNVSIRYGKYRLIRYRDGSTQFYDLSRDYWQLKDLGQGHRNFKAAKKALYEACRAWGYEIPEDPALQHPLVTTAETAKPTPKFARKNVPHRINMAKSNTALEEYVLATEGPKSKFGTKQPLGVLTMVYRDYDLLERWYNFYKRQIGAENIYIYSHGNDPKHREIAPDANVMNVPRDESFTLFEVNRWRMMGFFASAMLEFYRYMIVSDVDEFIIADPKTGMTTAEYIAAHYNKPDAPKNISPLGIEIIHVPDQEPLPIKPDENILDRRRFFRPNRNYSKPCIVGGPVSFGPGGHRNTLGPRHMPDDLYLVHLKYFDLKVLEDRATRQKDILAAAEESGGMAAESHPWSKTLANYYAILEKFEFCGEDIDQTAFRNRMKAFETEKFPRQYVWGYIKKRELYELPSRFGTAL